MEWCEHEQVTDADVVLNCFGQPTGIDIDNDGNLYLTEVPLPGVPGTLGGMNKVWKYAPDTRLHCSQGV